MEKIYLYGLRIKDKKEIERMGVLWDRYHIRPNGKQGSYFINSNDNNSVNPEIYNDNSNSNGDESLLTDQFINSFIKDRMNDFIQRLPKLYTFGCLNALNIISRNIEGKNFYDYDAWSDKGYTVKTKSSCFIDKPNFNDKEIQNLIKNMDYSIGKTNSYKIARYIIVKENDSYRILQKCYRNDYIHTDTLGLYNRSDLKAFFSEKISDSLIGCKKIPLWNEKQVAPDKTKLIIKPINPLEILVDADDYLENLYYTLCHITNTFIETVDKSNIKVLLKLLIDRYIEKIGFCKKDYFHFVTEIIYNVLINQYHIEDQNNFSIPDKIYDEDLRSKIDILQNIFLIAHSISKAIYMVYQDKSYEVDSFTSLLLSSHTEQKQSMNLHLYFRNDSPEIETNIYDYGKIIFTDNTEISFNLSADKEDDNVVLVANEMCYRDISGTNLNPEDITINIFKEKKIGQIDGDINEIYFKQVMFFNDEESIVLDLPPSIRDNKEKRSDSTFPMEVDKIPMENEDLITYYVMENVIMPSAGIFKNDLSLEQAIATYDDFPNKSLAVIGITSLKNKIPESCNLFPITDQRAKTIMDNTISKAREIIFSKFDQNIFSGKEITKSSADNVFITIWQVKKELKDIKHYSYFHVTTIKKVLINKTNYRKVIEFEFKKIDNLTNLLNELFVVSRFDPDVIAEYLQEDSDFKELSIGDVITVNCNNQEINYYVDEYGFHIIPYFSKEIIKGQNKRYNDFNTLYAINPEIAIMIASNKINLKIARIMAVIDNLNLPLPIESDLDFYLKKGNQISKEIISLDKKIVFQICVSGYESSQQYNIYTLEEVVMIQNDIKGSLINIIFFFKNDIYSMLISFNEKDKTIQESLKRNLEVQIKECKYRLKDHSYDVQQLFKKRLKELNIIQQILKDGL